MSTVRRPPGRRPSRNCRSCSKSESKLGDARRTVRARVEANLLAGAEILIGGLHDRERFRAAFQLDQDLPGALLRRLPLCVLSDDRAGNRTDSTGDTGPGAVADRMTHRV